MNMSESTTEATAIEKAEQQKNSQAIDNNNSEVLVPMADGTIISVKRYGKGNTIILVVADCLSLGTIEHTLALCANQARRVYIFHPRGHNGSEGRFEKTIHDRDVERFVHLLRKSYTRIILAAIGTDAFDCAKYSENGLAIDGLLLLFPNITKPVRVIAPAAVVLEGMARPPALFGQVRVIRGARQETVLLHSIQQSLQWLCEQEKPIRF